MRALWSNFIVELKLYVRSFMNVFFTIVFPLMMLFIFGEIFGNDEQVMFQNRGTVDASMPGYCVMIICVTGLMTLPITISTYREKKILKFYKGLPIGAGKLLGTQFLLQVLMTAGSILLLIGAAELAYDINFDGNIGIAVFAMVICILSIFSIGFFIASVASNAKTTTAFANIIYFPMIFLSGATMPLEILPDSLKRVAEFIPASYAVELMNGVFQGKALENYWKEIMILSGFFGVLTILSLKLFRWENK